MCKVLQYTHKRQAVPGAASSIGVDGGPPAVLRGATGGGAAAHGASATGLGRAAQLRRRAARVAGQADTCAPQATGQPLQKKTGTYHQYNHFCCDSK